MSVMVRTTSQPPRSRQAFAGNRSAAATQTLSQALRLMNEWPTSWQIDDGDLAYGQDLLEEFKPFVMSLIG
jgi:hypothetical protein